MNCKTFSGIITWCTSQGSGSPLSPRGCRDSLPLIGEQEQPMGWRDAVVSPALLATNAVAHKSTNSETQSMFKSREVSFTLGDERKKAMVNDTAT